MLHSRSTLVPIFTVLTFLTAQTASAHEGMWVPTLLKAIEGDMRTEGLQISAEDIYSINNGSLKDAVALFGSGCTADVVSTQGLILTNHHCGRSSIQNNSTLEHNYLRDGFMAATLADELPNAGLSVTFMVRIEDVSQRINALLNSGMGEEERYAVAKREGAAIIAEALEGNKFDAVVRPFNYGNSWFLIVSETFGDIRLVAAPPEGIGEFGGNADNWMWPRQTGDFSVFRIYASPENLPAEYAAENKPFTPRRSIAIDMGGAQAGEFAMIYGFPGTTQYYIPSYGVEQVMSMSDPLRIAMRGASLNVITAAMNADAATKIQYYSKRGSIANGWKKWQGELQGLTALGTVAKKQAEEAEFLRRATGMPEYAGILPRLEKLYAEQAPYAQARDLFSEFIYNGAYLPRFAAGFSKLIEGRDTISKAVAEAEVKRLRASASAFFKNYNATVDHDVFAAQLPLVLEYQSSLLATPALQAVQTKFNGNAQRYADDFFARSVFTDSLKLFRLLDHYSKKSAKKMAQDPAYQLGNSASTTYTDKIRPRYNAISDSLDAALRTWSKGLITLFPEKTWWPDANLTLRVSYGKVEGTFPQDGLAYLPFTTLDGVMAKYVPNDPEFNVPQKLIDLYNAKDFGPYATDGEMRTCFLSSLHTTGGNSGSPVFNGKGELIGINFDRTWESTMSDIQFDPAICRNISVDIKYVLFVIDKFLGGKRLVDEMELVGMDAEKVDGADGAPHVIELPLHR